MPNKGSFMRRLRMETLGACLGIATGFLAFKVTLYYGLLLRFLGVTGFGGDPASQPPIGPELGAILYSVAILGFGAFAFWSPKWGGAGLLLCAVTGVVFGSAKYPVVAVLSAAAGLLCLFGWWKDKDAAATKE